MDALSGRQILILSSIEWDAAWQRHQAFAAQWAQAGHEVFFVENTGFRRPGLRDARRVGRKLAGLTKPSAVKRILPKGLQVINPVVLPPTSPAFRRVNESVLLPRLAGQLTRAGLRPGALAVAYLPTATTLSLLDRLRPEITIYDCVDNFFGHPNAPADLARTEGELMRRSSLVVTTSRTLHSDKSKLHSNVLELHHGVAPEFFLPPAKRLEYKRFCYYGTLWKAIDYAPIRALAQAGFEVELIGPIREALPALPKTVRHRPQVPHEELPKLLEEVDALLLPYVNDEYNRGVIPAKTYECLATRRPVLTSPLPALEPLGGALYFCRTPDEWVQTAKRLGVTEKAGAVALRLGAAESYSAPKVFARLREAIAASVFQAHGR